MTQLRRAIGWAAWVLLASAAFAQPRAVSPRTPAATPPEIACCVYFAAPLKTGAKSMPPMQLAGISERLPDDQQDVFKAADEKVIRKGAYQLLAIPNQGSALEIHWTGQTSAADGKIELAVWDPFAGSYATYELTARTNATVSHVFEVNRPAAERFAFVLVGSPESGAQIATDLLHFVSLRSSPEAGRAAAPAAPDFVTRIDKSWGGGRRMVVKVDGALESCTRAFSAEVGVLPAIDCRPNPDMKLRVGDVVVIEPRRPLSGIPAGYESPVQLCAAKTLCQAVSGFVVQASLLEPEALAAKAKAAPTPQPSTVTSTPQACPADRELPASVDYHPSNAVPSAIRLLRQGDPVRALAHLEAGLKQRPGDPDIAVFLAALLHDADPTRAATLQSGAKLELPPVSPIATTEAPPKPKKAAYVSVANALIRAEAGPEGAVLARLPIATKVTVKKRAGDFWQVAFSQPGVKAKSGFVFDGLISSVRPTVAALTRRITSDGGANGADWQAMMWWRALNLEPKNAAVYEQLVSSAAQARRYGMIVEAMELATRAGRWPAGTTPATSAADLQLFLFRAAHQRAVGPLTARLEGLGKNVAVTEYDNETVPLSEYYADAFRKPEGIWRRLKVLSLRSQVDGPTQVSLTADDGAVVITGDCTAWRIEEFNLPGGTVPPK